MPRFRFPKVLAVFVDQRALHRSWEAYLLLEPRDMWVGVFWHREDWVEPDRVRAYRLSVYVCLLPCLPLRIRREWRTTENE